MPTTHQLLLAKAAQVACELSADQTEALALDVGFAPSPKRLLQVAGLAAPRSVVELCDLWIADGTVDGARLADTLRSAALAVKSVSTYEKIELVYTGPDASSLRRTLQALLEVIRAARERLWVVSYLMGPGVDPVLAAIRERVEAGVMVKVLLDHLHSSYALSKATLMQHSSAPEVFVWPDNKRQISASSMATLHAKCAVADGRRAFVSSANLAGYAMNHNLEVGYLVTGGPTPSALDRHLEALCTSGELARA